jgi:hypothetical protein
MAVKIMVPASAILENKEKTLVLDTPLRCSRCNRTPADFFESHRLKFRAGYTKTHLLGKKYAASREYTLKLRVCETCYQTDYLTAPETLDRDNTPLGRTAKRHSTAWMLGGLAAAVGFLLLTPIVPDTPALVVIKRLWQIPVVLGVLILLFTWLSQHAQQARVSKALHEAGQILQVVFRAEVRTPILADAQDGSVIALEIKLENELWAEECAGAKHWQAEKLPAEE